MRIPKNRMSGDIIFNDKVFPFRNVFLDNIDLMITVSTIDLNALLFNNKGEYISENARYIDEQIYFFVDKEQLALPEDQLVQYLKKNIQ